MSRCCPSCNSTDTKKNGHIHNGKQNHFCNACGRQFVENPGQILISNTQTERIGKLLLGRIPLRGICRVEGVSLRWLLDFMVNRYDQLPDDLNFQVKAQAAELIIYTLESEIDEMFSFVSQKKNKQWISMALDVKSRQIIAVHVGDRSRQSAKALWKSIPQRYRNNATFYTDGWGAYEGVFHKATSTRQQATSHHQSYRAL